LKELGINVAAQEIKETMRQLDVHHNNKIDYSEFLAATFDQKRFLTRERLWAAFKYFDKDNAGAITKEKLKAVLLGASDERTSNFTEGEIEGMISEVS